MVKLYLESFKFNIKKQLEYKSSFIMNALSQLFLFFTYYFIIIGLFNKFNNIKGFTLFETLVINGELDRLLLRPRGILLQVLCNEIDFVKIIRMLQSLIIMIISLIKLDIIWNISKVITLILMVLSSILIFFGIFVLTASYCFITVQGLEIKNVFTDGGKNLAQYPIGIYKKGVSFFFTFIIPYAFINYYPLLYFIDKTDNILYMLSPILVFVFLIPCLLSFKIGLKHYSSTGS